MDIDRIDNILRSDVALIGDSYKNLFDSLESKTILITGATGIIGTTAVKTILEKTKSAKVIALIRNKSKAEEIFKNYLQQNSRLSFLCADVTKPIENVPGIDYIIHAASETSSKAFTSSPVETIATALDGTKNILELAKSKNISGMVYLSSMEVYGAPATDEKISETHNTNLQTTEVRTSYPESKRMCESLCVAYASEYQVPAKIVRLTQTFGPGVNYNDGRVFAEFARCAIEKRDIVLHTKGETKRNYLYTLDAVMAILTVLVVGTTGEAYNAANENTYCSIYEMAELVAQEISNGKIKVNIKEEDTAKFGFAPPLKMNLDTHKLRDIGWSPRTPLKEMFEKLIQTL